MNVMVVGSGGREHALAWALAQSESVSRVFVVPGNGGTILEPKCVNVAIDVSNFPALTNWARRYSVGLTVVGPEDPMAEGIRDHFDKQEIPCLAPSQKAAQLESSKLFAKEFMQRHQIPTAKYASFTESDEAIAYLDTCSTPVVIKADGLAAGKGVVVASSKEEAQTAVTSMLQQGQLGDAGSQILIEEFLTGVEASYIVLTDGKNFVKFASSQDHKPVFDGNQGPNTGGMGAYSPALCVDADVEDKVLNQIMKPCIQGMAEEGIPFQGFLYAGLMISPEKDVHVVEFNCRFGDPEAQAVLYRLKSDFAQLCMKALEQELEDSSIEFSTDAALGVVLASEGYPRNYENGRSISGLELNDGTSKVFHAGTALENNEFKTAGGRVLCVVGTGADLQAALDSAYQRVEQIQFEGQHYRSDIGFQALGTQS